MREHDRRGDEPVEFDEVVCKRETDKALLCEIDGTEHWIPKSQLLRGNEIECRGVEGKLVIPRWLAIEKKLIDEDDDE